jgi:hypothetical protein
MKRAMERQRYTHRGSEDPLQLWFSPGREEEDHGLLEEEDCGGCWRRKSWVIAGSCDPSSPEMPEKKKRKKERNWQQPRKD